MDEKRRIAYGLICGGLIFVGVFHLVFSTVFGYGLQAVSALLVAAGLFGLFLIKA
ncbi:MAG: hypothetical protein PPP58_12480 [Natronomonas sp.]